MQSLCNSLSLVLVIIFWKCPLPMVPLESRNYVRYFFECYRAQYFVYKCHEINTCYSDLPGCPALTPCLGFRCQSLPSLWEVPISCPLIQTKGCLSKPPYSPFLTRFQVSCHFLSWPFTAVTHRYSHHCHAMESLIIWMTWPTRQPKILSAAQKDYPEQDTKCFISRW